MSPRSAPEPALDVVVVGAGVVGLAVARALALAGRDVTVVEAAAGIGTHASSRNSEVIHAGIYYPAGSLKARLCVAGKQALYAYAAARGIAHRRLGKLIVAAGAHEVSSLEGYRARAAANGVEDLVAVDSAELRQLEPAVEGQAALLSPSTGILDSHAFMLALKGDLEDAGGRVVLSCPLVRARAGAAGPWLEVGGRGGGGSPGGAGAGGDAVPCRLLVNAAGLFAQDVARQIEGLPAGTIPPQHFAKGHYFYLRGRSPFSRLVYPLPEPGGLGIHVTLDLAGRARFGPEVTWVDGPDYRFDEGLAPAFYQAIRRYYPALADGVLEPGYTGVRPKLGPAGAPAQDFVIQGPEAHGVPGVINLYGIESPGLTASLAIAEHVATLANRP
jgi:L-2-hydroxyglutarate oxidase LhgO